MSITTRLQYDIINGDKRTRAWIHKISRFLEEFQELKRLEITEVVLLTQVRQSKMTFALSKDSDQPWQPGQSDQTWQMSRLI